MHSCHSAVGQLERTTQTTTQQLNYFENGASKLFTVYTFDDRQPMYAKLAING